MSTTNGAAFDCDTHIYEPRDAMTRYLPERFLDRSIRPIANAHGKDVVLAGTRIATFNSEEGWASTSPTGPDHCGRCSRRCSPAIPMRVTRPNR